MKIQNLIDLSARPELLQRCIKTFEHPCSPIRGDSSTDGITLQDRELKKQGDPTQFAERIKIIRQMCDKLITEVQKEKPNRLTISNILTEKIAEELDLAESIFYGFRPANEKLHSRFLKAVGVVEGKAPDSLLENEHR